MWWAGRFAEAASRVPVVMLPRRAVKLTLCGDSRAKDANIRQAFLDKDIEPAEPLDHTSATPAAVKGSLGTSCG